MVRRVAPVILALAGCLAFGGGEASAGQLSCGDTITEDTTLQSDLLDCPNNGLVIDANHITLDLNGHTIEGDGELVDPCLEFCDIGVEVFRHSGVRVKHGRLRGFAFGALVFRGHDARLSDLATVDSIFSGILIGNSTGSRVRGSSVSANGLTTDQAGITTFNTRNVRISGNRVFENGDIGFFMDNFNRGRIRNNRVWRNPEAGMIALESDRNAIRHNHFSRSGDGIIVAGSRNGISRNQVSSISAGCPVGCGTGIGIDEGHDNRISHNLVRDASEGIRIGVRARYARKGQRVKDTVARGNHLRHHNGDGLVVESSAVNTVLRGNRARRSMDDGLDIKVPSVALRRNRANRNADLGIDAVDGAINRGGNRAQRNGDPRQCRNVHCK